jgi:hypothetical protein
VKAAREDHGRDLGTVRAPSWHHGSGSGSSDLRDLPSQPVATSRRTLLLQMKGRVLGRRRQRHSRRTPLALSRLDSPAPQAPRYLRTNMLSASVVSGMEGTGFDCRQSKCALCSTASRPHRLQSPRGISSHGHRGKVGGGMKLTVQLNEVQRLGMVEQRPHAPTPPRPHASALPITASCSLNTKSINS